MNPLKDGEVSLDEWPTGSGIVTLTGALGSHLAFSEVMKDGGFVIINGVEHVVHLRNGSEIVFAEPPSAPPMPRDHRAEIEAHVARFDEHHAPRNRKERRALRSKR